MYNAYIDGLMKGGDTQKAVEIFERMKRDRCQPSTATYTMLINLYGKVNYINCFILNLSIAVSFLNSTLNPPERAIKSLPCNFLFP